MDRYDAANDHYCYPGTSVLENKLGIRDLDILEDAEREITSIKIDNVTYQTPPYGLEYMQSLHRILFSDLYDWAGRPRSATIIRAYCFVCRI